MSGRRNSLLRAVHARARELGLDEASRRGLQWEVTGLDSAAEMDAAQLRAVLREMDRRGGGRRDDLPDTPSARRAMALWLSAWDLGVVRDRSRRALCAYVRRQTGLDAARWATSPDDARRVTEGLKAWIGRVAGVDWRPFARGGYRPDLRVLQAQIRILAASPAMSVVVPREMVTLLERAEPMSWPEEAVREWQGRLGKVIRGTPGVTRS